MMQSQTFVSVDGGIEISVGSVGDDLFYLIIESCWNKSEFASYHFVLYNQDARAYYQELKLNMYQVKP